MGGRAEVVAKPCPLGSCARFVVTSARLALLRGDRAAALASSTPPTNWRSGPAAGCACGR